MTEYSDTAVQEYVSGLQDQKTLEDLSSFLSRWEEIAPDAVACIPKDEGEFEQFRSGLEKERCGEFAGEAWTERYGPVIIPAMMLDASLLADIYGIPWSVAIRHILDT